MKDIIDAQVMVPKADGTFIESRRTLHAGEYVLSDNGKEVE